jgi:hypothetical protein
MNQLSPVEAGDGPSVIPPDAKRNVLVSVIGRGASIVLNLLATVLVIR